MAQNGPQIGLQNSLHGGLPTVAGSSPHYAHIPHDSALSVGSSKAEEDAARIRDLEDEVRVLAERANSASQKFADYENEIRVLEAKLRQEQRKNTAAAAAAAAKSESPDPAAASPQDRPGISRFGSFIGSRNKTAAPQNGTAPPNGSREKELEEKLVQEQTTRIAAEKKVKEVNAEIEDLSATLFQQANEMVAAERKEKADLNEKNAFLRQQLEQLEDEQRQRAEQQQQQNASLDEKQQMLSKASDDKLTKENERLKEKLKRLEQREGERKKRLERLEAASKRVERVKALLQPP